MQIVIDIPEDVYKRTVFYREFRDLSDCVATIKALEKATPLPKGHGRLIDADAYREAWFNSRRFEPMLLLDFAPTIIEATEEVQGMSWGDKEQGKLYSRDYYQQHKEKFKEYNRRYRAEHRDELQAKRKEYNRQYEDKLKTKRDEEGRQLSDAEKEQRENMRAVSKEEWLERYGYPMGDTSNWENWAGWDRRIRRGEEE